MPQTLSFSFFYQLNNNHVLSIILIAAFAALSIIRFKPKKGLVLTLGFVLIHECVFAIFAVLKYNLPLNFQLGYDFLFFMGIYLSCSMTFLTKVQLTIVVLGYWIYLTIWYFLGFHLTHNVFTGVRTIYYSDPLINVLEIGSWYLLALLFILAPKFGEKTRQR